MAHIRGTSLADRRESQLEKNMHKSVGQGAVEGYLCKPTNWVVCVWLLFVEGRRGFPRDLKGVLSSATWGRSGGSASVRRLRKAGMWHG